MLSDKGAAFYLLLSFSNIILLTILCILFFPTLCSVSKSIMEYFIFQHWGNQFSLSFVNSIPHRNCVSGQLVVCLLNPRHNSTD